MISCPFALSLLKQKTVETVLVLMTTADVTFMIKLLVCFFVVVGDTPLVLYALLAPIIAHHCCCWLMAVVCKEKRDLCDCRSSSHLEEGTICAPYHLDYCILCYVLPSNSKATFISTFIDGGRHKSLGTLWFSVFPKHFKGSCYHFT